MGRRGPLKAAVRSHETLPLPVSQLCQRPGLFVCFHLYPLGSALGAWTDLRTLTTSKGSLARYGPSSPAPDSTPTLRLSCDWFTEQQVPGGSVLSHWTRLRVTAAAGHRAASLPAPVLNGLTKETMTKKSSNILPPHPRACCSAWPRCRPQRPFRDSKPPGKIQSSPNTL